MRKLERVRPKPASLRDNLGSCVAIAISSSSKGFSLPFFTPPYPTALSGFGTRSLPSQSLSQGRLAWGLFQQHCHSHSATVWKAELSHPLAACPGARRTLAQHQVRSGNQRLGPSLVQRGRFQARRVGSHSLSLPQWRLEPPFPVQPTIGAHLSKRALQTLSTSHHFPLPQKPRIFEGIRVASPGEGKVCRNQFVTSGKTVPTTHLGGCWESPW